MTFSAEIRETHPKDKLLLVLKLCVFFVFIFTFQANTKCSFALATSRWKRSYFFLEIQLVPFDLPFGLRENVKIQRFTCCTCPAKHCQGRGRECLHIKQSNVRTRTWRRICRYSWNGFSGFSCCGGTDNAASLLASLRGRNLRFRGCMLTSSWWFLLLPLLPLPLPLLLSRSLLESPELLPVSSGWETHTHHCHCSKLNVGANCVTSDFRDVLFSFSHHSSQN